MNILKQGDELITIKECIGWGDDTHVIPKGVKVILKRVDTVIVAIQEILKNPDGTCTEVETEAAIDIMSLARCET
jgi:hypothetical protein